MKITIFYFVLNKKAQSTSTNLIIAKVPDNEKKEAIQMRNERFYFLFLITWL